jgi:hypothetical protein
LALAMLTRIALLFSIVWLTKLTMPLFAVMSKEFSGRDLIFIIGGLFLLAKSTYEIHEKLEGAEGESSRQIQAASFAGVIAQIILLDIIFSLDSVITAVGMANNQRLCRAPSDSENSGAELSDFDRGDFDCRWPWPAYFEGLYLFRHGVLRVRRDSQPQNSQTRRRPGQIAAGLC